jgi:hypothetical protein
LFEAPGVFALYSQEKIVLNSVPDMLGMWRAADPQQFRE